MPGTMHQQIPKPSILVQYKMIPYTFSGGNKCLWPYSHGLFHAPQSHQAKHLISWSVNLSLKYLYQTPAHLW